jgi:sensor histidine kinase regulating citrate/malate metabolism
MQRSRDNAEAVAVYNSQLVFFSKEYDNLARINQEMRELKHDWKRHLDMIGSLVHSGDIAKQIEYIAELQTVLSRERMSYVGDPVVDILISGLLRRAEQSGIEVDITTNLPYPIMISPIDLCVLISNSTDNALEGCARIVNGNKKIWISIKTTEVYIFYTIRNTYGG